MISGGTWSIARLSAEVTAAPTQAGAVRLLGYSSCHLYRVILDSSYAGCRVGMREATLEASSEGQVRECP